ncbi:MAG TPA: hypothetical protein VN622_13635 [Clostridia bacterium]|nr:hypothetical protein [Clostridia bacterium]
MSPSRKRLGLFRFIGAAFFQSSICQFRYPLLMPRPSPFTDGLRALSARPDVLLAEIAWRWTFALAAVALLLFSSNELQHALEVTPQDQLLLATMQPFLMAGAISNVLRSALPLLTRLAAILLPAYAILWIIAATIGRASTLTTLVEHFTPAETPEGSSAPQPRIPWSALFMLHFLRITALLALVLGYFGSAAIAALNAGTADEPHIIRAVLAFLGVLSLSLLFWSAINWVLSVAPIFAIRDGRSSLDSISEAVAFWRRNKSTLASAAALNGLLRSVLAVATAVAALGPISLMDRVPAASGIALALITLLYLVISDALLVARLASYVSIAANSDQSPRPLPVPTPELS